MSKTIEIGSIVTWQTNSGATRTGSVTRLADSLGCAIAYVRTNAGHEVVQVERLRLA